MLRSNLNINWVPGITIEEMEMHCILQALSFYSGNKTVTAQSLGIAIRTLDNKMEKYEEDDRRRQVAVEQEKIKRDEILQRMRGIPQQFDGNRPIAYQPGSQRIEPTTQNSGHKTSGESAGSGVRVESTQNTTEKHSVPMPQRKEVQTVLSRRAGGSNTKRGR